MKTRSWHDFRNQASDKPARIILADGTDPRVVEAAAAAFKNRIAKPLLVGSHPDVRALWKQFETSSEPPCIDPGSLPSAETDRLVNELLRLPKFRALSRIEAEARIKDPLIFGCLYTRCGLADGFIGGATRTTADTLKAVFAVIGLAHKTSTLFGFFLIEHRQGGTDPTLVLLADCAVTPDPSAKQLANIAAGAADAYRFFLGEEPRTVFLSFSTHGSADHAMVAKIQEAVSMTREKHPDIKVEGEWQADAALDRFSARMKGVGESPMAGIANVLIVPDLNCGNIAYKLVQRLGGCRAVGPVLWGTAQPANDLSRGCSADDVLDMMALTSLQARNAKTMEKIAHG